MSHHLTLKSISPVTHDTHHLVFDRPRGFTFDPGQGVEISLDQDGWRDEGRPFTLVSLPDEDSIDFVIKSYPDHDGVTERIGRLKPGDTVWLDGPFGAISDKGPGVFIAGGAGVTPMIGVLRKRLHDHGTLAGSTLVFSNKTEADIIWREKFEEMPGLTCAFVVSGEAEGATVPRQRLDRDYLRQFVEPGTRCYLCGPPPMMDAVRSVLRDLKAGEIVEEEMS